MDAFKAPNAYEFSMDRWLPATLPMKRLAQYMEKLSALLGDVERVHFVKITKGSARQAFHVENDATEAVWQRLCAANDGTWVDGVKLRKDINRMLLQDDNVGSLRVVGGPKVMDFPGRKTPISQEVVVHEAGELEGMIIRVGGKDPTVPVMLQGADDYYRCNATRTIAKQLAQRLFEGQVRVSGKGKWLRNAEGVWSLDAFDIVSFEPLDSASLGQFVSEVRAIPGSHWNEVDDPHAELRLIRGED